MTITPDIRQQVRQRANFACEFCGVAEVDTGGELTIDPYQPQTKKGSDDLDNLISVVPDAISTKLTIGRQQKMTFSYGIPAKKQQNSIFWNLKAGCCIR